MRANPVGLYGFVWSLQRLVSMIECKFHVICCLVGWVSKILSNLVRGKRSKRASLLSKAQFMQVLAKCVNSAHLFPRRAPLVPSLRRTGAPSPYAAGNAITVELLFVRRPHPPSLPFHRSSELLALLSVSYRIIYFLGSFL